MLSRIRVPLLVITFAALIWASAPACVAQTSVEAFRKVLRKQAAFTDVEFAALEQGEAVVKLLPERDKREVAFCGLIRLQGNPATSLTAFGEALMPKYGRAVLAGGGLRTPPALEDLQSLTLENRDLEDMRRCEVGDCRLKLSAAMIERLRTGVDWDAPDYPLQATRLFRQMIFEHLGDYLARGDAALVEYDGRAAAARQAAEQRSLLDSLPYVNDSAPEFAAYLRSFPRAELPGVENALRWSKIKFGLKPVIVITHTATYTRQRNDARQIFIATRQLYANHYIDSSLSLTILMEVPAGDAASDTYLLYANRSRVDAFDGLFGGVKRRMVEQTVLDGLEAILQQTKQNVQIQLANQSNSASPADVETACPRRWAQRLLGGGRFILLVLLIVASVLYVWLGRRDARGGVS